MLAETSRKMALRCPHTKAMPPVVSTCRPPWRSAHPYRCQSSREHQPPEIHHAEGASLIRKQSIQPMLMAVGTAASLLAGAVHPEASYAIQMEPANALSLPTWAIHVSSVVEWVIAMNLMWRYAEVSGNPRWKGMTWGMLPALGSAMSACTWHFFYNSPDLEFLVGLQAALTVIGNTTCLIAAYRIWDGARLEAKP